jgi:probable rRNA maturation factor
MNVARPMELEVQHATSATDLPVDPEFTLWAESALAAAGRSTDLSMTVRLVDTDESRSLNENYRSRNGPTNVLAFPGGDFSESVPAYEREFGDLVICVPLVRREAAEQGKDFVAHLAHLVVHGTLHLAGFNHDDLHAAKDMELLEKNILIQLGFSDPYNLDAMAQDQ